MKSITAFPLTLLILCQPWACSFKKQDDNRSVTLNEELRSESNQDSDGDLILDNEDISPFVADLPFFEGDFFQEMKVTTHFYNSVDHRSDSATFHVKKDLTALNGVPAEERDFLGNSSQFLFEESAISIKRNSLKGFHYTIDHSIEDLGYYSAPRLNDAKVFPYSQKISTLSKSYQFEAIDISIVSRLRMNYERASFYKDIWFDLYWYDDMSRSFRLIDSALLNGSFNFNQDYTVSLQFRSSNAKLTKEISEGGGRFIYLKVRDFNIPHQGYFYNQLLDSVKTKSVGVMYSDGMNTQLKFIGINSQPQSLKTIFERFALPEYSIDGSEILKVGTKTNFTGLEHDPYGMNSLVENKWFISTNEISNNPFSYSFSPKDLVVLSYLSNSQFSDIIPSYFGITMNSKSTDIQKTIKILKQNLKDLRINLRPITVTTPVNTSTVQLCEGHKVCFTYNYTVRTLSGLNAFPGTSFIFLTINSKEFSLAELISKKLAEVRLKNSQFYEIRLTGGILNSIPDSNGVTITFTAKPAIVNGCTGTKYCESAGDGCQRLLTYPPSCEESGDHTGYTLKDFTKKTPHEVTGEMFLSVEFI